MLQIEWKVLDVTWEKCTLRKWLNEDFYNKAFDEEEKERVVLSEVPATKNPEYDTDLGNPTRDRMFLLSIQEVERYITDDEGQICQPTVYCTKRLIEEYKKRFGEDKGYERYRKRYENSTWWRLRCQ